MAYKKRTSLPALLCCICIVSVRWIPLTEPLHLVFVRHVEVALLLVQLVDALHLVGGQGEVKSLDILLDVLGVRRAGNHRESFLQMPADDDPKALPFALGLMII